MNDQSGREEGAQDPLRAPLLHPEEDYETTAPTSDLLNQWPSTGIDDRDTLSDDESVEANITDLVGWQGTLHKTLLPDRDWKFGASRVLDSDFSVKLAKFLMLTFGGIFWMHWLVSHRIGYRDEGLKAWQIWVFDGGLIVRDAGVFFLVGRLWKQQGVDHLAWIGTVLVCNLYLELQNYISWIQFPLDWHRNDYTSWSWAVWGCMGLRASLIAVVVFVRHFVRAWRDKTILVRLVEVSFFGLFFLAPVVSSPYFIFHPWFAGWMFGTHCSFNVWWSRATMAWCWGLYIHSIALYGRDHLLTCQYDYYLSIDQRCPYLECGVLPDDTKIGS